MKLFFVLKNGSPKLYVYIYNIYKPPVNIVERVEKKILFYIFFI